MNFKKITIYLLKISAAVAIIWYMIHSGRLNVRAIYGAKDNFGLIILSFLIMLIAIFVTFYRWKLLLKGQDIILDNKEIISLGFIGIFFTSVLPGAVGGDIIKGVYIAKKVKGRKISSVLTVLLDRIIGLAALIIICAVGLLMNIKVVLQNGALRSLGMIILISLLAIIIMTSFGLSRRIRQNVFFNNLINKLPLSNFLNKIYDAFHAYRYKHKYLTYALLLSFVNHALNITIFYLIALALGFDQLGIFSYFFIVPLGLITMAIPITPAGIGIGQAAFLKLFEWSLGTKTTIGADTITIWQVIFILISFVGSAFYIAYKKEESKH
ncbi:MAG: lysylphosphatidylglycerol synthase transmembrane domain-containing protein [Proteobacteria bacterium]|nr:lysylphosphatidylglycerol synthase transmembrane domain-containing protein [Pseudomonadota bacterium]